MIDATIIGDTLAGNHIRVIKIIEMVGTDLKMFMIGIISFREILRKDEY